MRTLSVRLDDQTDALLRAYCARTGVNQTDAIKSGILALSQTTNNQSPAELADALGLIGCFESGSGDLGRSHSQRVREKLIKQKRSGQGRG